MFQTLRNVFAVIIFFFAVLFVYTKLFGPIPFTVNSTVTQNPSVFQTTGTGEAEGVPDKASVSLGVTQTAESADEARSKANAIINKVVEDLKKLGIKENDIKTTNFSVYPNQEPVILEQGTSSILPRPGESAGFTASANIEVQTDSVDLANKAIDAASAAGANVIGGVTFTFDDEAQKKLEKEAREEAVKEAKEKANELASAAGIKLGKVINITESGGGFPIPYGSALKQDIGEQTDLALGENTVTITVTLTFETQ